MFQVKSSLIFNVQRKLGNRAWSFASQDFRFPMSLSACWQPFYSWFWTLCLIDSVFFRKRVMIGVYIRSCSNIFSIYAFHLTIKLEFKTVSSMSPDSCKKLKSPIWPLSSGYHWNHSFLPEYEFYGFSLSLYFIAWCLRSEGVSSVLLGVSNTDQLLENLGALRVHIFPFFPSRIHHFGWHTEPQSFKLIDMLLCVQYKVAKQTKTNRSHFKNFFAVLLSSLQILSQMTPQTITEIDALLGNKPHLKKESRAWRCKSEWQMMFQEERWRRQWHWETSLFALLYTQQLACPQQHYASSMCAYPFCAVHCIMYEKKKKRKSLNC